MDFSSIFETTETTFPEKALEVFHYQYAENEIYRQFCDYLKRTPKIVQTLADIPFLPISFFKTHSVFCGKKRPTAFFTSSGTTGIQTSTHWVRDMQFYETSYRKGFSNFYGEVENYVVLALLPNYLERTGSSLIHMVGDFIQKSKHPASDFYLHNVEELAAHLTDLDQNGQKILLIGVSFALLDLVEKYSFSLKNTIVMETGGMKGRRKELVREELHEILKKGFGVEKIHSEYGMTELLSQAYSHGDGVFSLPPWLKILIRDPEDALSYHSHGKTGGINVIDLANVHSCSFIATQDLGKTFANGTFEVLGRFDHADIRGCNLLVM